MTGSLRRRSPGRESNNGAPNPMGVMPVASESLASLRLAASSLLEALIITITARAPSAEYYMYVHTLAHTVGP